MNNLVGLKISSGISRTQNTNNNAAIFFKLPSLSVWAKSLSVILLIKLGNGIYMYLH